MTGVGDTHGMLWLGYRLIALAVHPSLWTVFALGFSLFLLYRWRTR